MSKSAGQRFNDVLVYASSSTNVESERPTKGLARNDRKGLAIVVSQSKRDPFFRDSSRGVATHSTREASWRKPDRLLHAM